MNYRNIAALCLVLLTVCLGAEGTRTVRVGAFNYYPGIFRDTDGMVKGFYVDSLDEIGRQENIRFEYVWGSWNEGLDRIRSGEVDVLTSVAWTEERAAYMDYGKTPLLTVWSEVYVRNDSDIDNIMDLEGKKIALMKGDFNAQNFRELALKFHLSVEYLEVASFDEVFGAIAGKKADAGVVNCTFGVAKQLESGIRSTGVVFNPFDIFLTVGKGQNTELIGMFDRYLDKWKHQESSVFNRSRQKWSHGTVGSIQIIPSWLKYGSALLAFLAVVFFSFVILLRLRVQKATAEIVQRELLLKQSETKLRSYIENAPDGVFVAGPEGNYLEVNPAAAQITGYSTEELLNLSIADLLPAESLENSLAYFEALKTRGHSRDELQYRHKSGEKRWWAVNGVKLSESRYLGFARDITERKTSEERIRLLLAEKELLLKEVHHRIKNNMNTIKGLLYLQSEAQRDTAAWAALHDAENRVQSMIILYDKLYCSNNYRELSVRDYLQTLSDEILTTFPNRNSIRLEQRLEDFILNVQYLAPLGIILNELLTNSMKHGFAGDRNGVIIVSASKTGDRVTFSVADNGAGLDDTGTAEHTGFGLSLVRMLTEQIAGTVDIVSGPGTTVTVYFSV